jgi:putative FmdB family regulatory protein
MPTYEYRRKDGSTFEVTQRITDEPLKTCPTTGQQVKRLIGGGVGLIFKGSGFYLTDYARKDKGKVQSSNGASSKAKKEEPSKKTEKKTPPVSTGS